MQRISELFIVPFLKYRPDGMEIKTWLEHLFHVGERKIEEYTASEDFKMPGLFKIYARKAIQGYGYRTVRQFTKVLVRSDSTDPTRIDVEVNNGQGKKEQVFQLTPWELRKIKPFLI